MSKTNPMRNINVEKVTLNIGVGKNQDLLEKGLKLLERLTKRKPVKTITSKRIAAWALRPGLPIGAKVTVRGKDAVELISRLVYAKDMILKESNFDNNGNISFGIPEYIEIKNLEYDPAIGIIGLQVCIKLQRAGFRIARRKLSNKKIPKSEAIAREEAIEYMKTNFKVKFGEAQ